MSKKFDGPLSLAVETSGRAGSITLGAGEEIFAEIVFSGQMRHSAELFSAAEQLLCDIDGKSGDIGYIYISIGPGSFTGLRISAAFAKMMALAGGVKIVTIGTSDTIALNARDYLKTSEKDVRRIATIIDAKRKQFFVASFDLVENNWQKVTDDCLMSSDSFIEQFSAPSSGLKAGFPLYLLGEGLVYYKDKFKCAGIDFIPEIHWSARSSSLYKLGHKKALEGLFANPATFAPMYLRKPV